MAFERIKKFGRFLKRTVAPLAGKVIRREVKRRVPKSIQKTTRKVVDVVKKDPPSKIITRKVKSRSEALRRSVTSKVSSGATKALRAFTATPRSNISASAKRAAGPFVGESVIDKTIRRQDILRGEVGDRSFPILLSQQIGNDIHSAMKGLQRLVKSLPQEKTDILGESRFTMRDKLLLDFIKEEKFPETIRSITTIGALPKGTEMIKQAHRRGFGKVARSTFGDILEFQRTNPELFRKISINRRGSDIEQKILNTPRVRRFIDHERNLDNMTAGDRLDAVGTALDLVPVIGPGAKIGLLGAAGITKPLLKILGKSAKAGDAAKLASASNVEVMDRVAQRLVTHGGTKEVREGVDEIIRNSASIVKDAQAKKAGDEVAQKLSQNLDEVTDIHTELSLRQEEKFLRKNIDRPITTTIQKDVPFSNVKKSKDDLDLFKGVVRNILRKNANPKVVAKREAEKVIRGLFDLTPHQKLSKDASKELSAYLQNSDDIYPVIFRLADTKSTGAIKGLLRTKEQQLIRRAGTVTERIPFKGTDPNIPTRLEEIQEMSRPYKNFSESQLQNQLKQSSRKAAGLAVEAEVLADAGGKVDLNNGEKVAKFIDEFTYKKEPETIGESGRKAVNAIKKTGQAIERTQINQFNALDSAQKQLLKAHGKTRDGLKLSEVANLFSGTQGKITSKLMDFDKIITKVITKTGGSLEQFSQYVSMRRVLSRLSDNPLQKQFAGKTIKDMVDGIAHIKLGVGDEVAEIFEQAADEYNVFFRQFIEEMEAVGRLSTKQADIIRNSNDFYAPFNIIIQDDLVKNGVLQGIDLSRSIDDVMRLASKSITPKAASEIQSIKGIKMLGKGKDSVVMLEDVIEAAHKKIPRLIEEIERQRFTRRIIGDLEKADTAEAFIKKIGPKKGDQALRKPVKGMEQVFIYEDGKKVFYHVDKGISDALKGLNLEQASTIVRLAGKTSIPMKFGAIAYNTGFNAVNALIADMGRNLFLNKAFGINPLRVTTNYLSAFFESIGYTVFGSRSKMMQDFMESGAFTGAYSRTLAKELLKPIYNTSKAGALKKFVFGVLRLPTDIGGSLEITGKLAGFREAEAFLKRQQKLVNKGAKNVKNVVTREELMSEVRKVAGSPDFWARGTWTPEMNALFPFYNAATQGTVTDVSRLFVHPFKGTRKERIASAKAWAKLSVPMTGVAAITAYNLRPGNREHFEQVSQWERDSYIMIPKFALYGKDDDRSYGVNEDGKKFAEYWKVQKRDGLKLVFNLVESGVTYFHDRDPHEFARAMDQFLTDALPVNIESKEGHGTLDPGGRLKSLASSTAPIIKAPIEIATGIDLFRGRPIEPQSIEGEPTSKVSSDRIFREKTPEIFKKFGQTSIAKRLGISPLEAEQFASSATGGLTRRLFGDSRLREGEEQPGLLKRLTTQPIKDRFRRSTFVVDPVEDSRFEQIGEVQESQANIGVDLSRKAKGSLQKIRDLRDAGSPEEGRKVYDALPEKERKKVDTIIARENLERHERAIKSLGVENGGRTISIIKIINSENMTEGEAVEFIRNLKQKKIITEDVNDQLRRHRDKITSF